LRYKLRKLSETILDLCEIGNYPHPILAAGKWSALHRGEIRSDIARSSENVSFEISTNSRKLFVELHDEKLGTKNHDERGRAERRERVLHPLLHTPQSYLSSFTTKN